MRNICFHGIGTPQRELEPGEAEYWIDRTLFADVLDQVRGRPDIVLSFDDGNRSDVEIALPMLLERRLRATFFPLAGRLGQPGSLDGADLRDLVAHGMGIGSHGMDHRPWRDLDDRQLHRELVTAREVLTDAAGAAIRAVACPLGSYDRRVLVHARAQGYRQVFTSDRASARGRGWLQPRFSIRTGDTAPAVTAPLPAADPRSVARTARVQVKRWR